MPYSIYRLTFPAGVHIGTDRGPSPDETQMTIYTDTLFSALYTEALRMRRADILLQAVQSGHLIFSDALPYSQDDLYLPRPILHAPLRARRIDPSQAKALRSLEYLPLSRFADYVQEGAGGRVDVSALKTEFGAADIRIRAAIRGLPEPLPYQVAVFRFRAGFGLYVLAFHMNEDTGRMFAELLTSLGYSGIGGLRSSGSGRFTVQAAAAPPALTVLLEAKEAPWQMLLGAALPADDELEAAVSGGWYTLARRAGYVASPDHAATPLKKRTSYALRAGSCLKRRFSGSIVDVSPAGQHPVWRCGKSLFVGVNVCASRT